MRIRLSKRLIQVGALVAASAASLLAAAPAGAAPLGTAPQFFTPQTQQFRAAGSETTYYLMNAINNLYSQTSIYGCTLSATDNRTCVTTSDGSATDTQDDYSRNEFINGSGVGTGSGIKMLCGDKPTGGLSVDLARGSRAPQAGDCSTNDVVGLQYAKDSVVADVFPFVNQSTVTCTGTCSATQIGPVAAGWRTGDPIAGPYTGRAFTNITNNDNAFQGGTKSLAYEIYCDTTTSEAITDWGQLSDLSQPIGKGAPIGVPIYIPAVNTGSGTYSVWKSFVGCDPNTKNADAKIVQENDAPQLVDIAVSDHGTDNIAAYNQVAASLYYISFGVSQWRPYTRAIPNPATAGAKFDGKLSKINGTTASPAVELNGTIASVRGLYNIYRTGHLRASVAGFLNWICDTDPAKANHGLDLTTGKNYSDELTNTISTQYVFPRVPCKTDGSGNSIPPLAASDVSDLNS